MTSPVDQIEDALKQVSAEITDRERLLRDLVKVRQLGFKKMEYKNSSNSERISWARVIINSCKVSDQIMKSKEQDEIVYDVLELKKAVNNIQGKDNDA
jgi:hypothetical protein